MTNFKRIKECTIKSVEAGKANNIAEFFNNVIKPQFKHKKEILEIHKSLMEYIKSPNSTYFIRKFGSFPKDKYELLRRGFLTQYPDGTRMVFCDNTFAMLFAACKISGIAYTKEDLLNLFESKSLICSFGTTTLENELSYYTNKGAILCNLNTYGWYLAHIKPVGKYYDKDHLKDFFTNPDRDEWDVNTKIRRTNNNLKDKEARILKAHFIRLIHPFNSFLVPKKTHMIYDGKNIGEEQELLSYVENYLREEFKEEFKEFDNISLRYSEMNNVKIEKNIEHLMWTASPHKLKKQISTKASKIEKNNTSKQTKILNENIENITVENDPDVQEMSMNLERTLNSIGKGAFILFLYPELIKNIEATVDDISCNHKQYSEYSINTQSSRLSSAKSIFRKNLVLEALEIISNSNSSKCIKQRAKEYLESYPKQ